MEVTSKEIFDKIEIFVFNALGDNAKITEESLWRCDVGMDSLDLIDLTFFIEKDYDIPNALDDLDVWNDVDGDISCGRIASIIAEQINKDRL